MQSAAIVVSSYPLIIEGIRAMLVGYEGISIIYTASSCQEASLKIKEHSPDIAIVDLQLLDGSGINVIRDCKAINDVTKFLFISSIEKGNYFEQAVARGAHGFLLNSLTKEELMTAIRTALDNEIYIHPKLASAIFGAKASPNDKSAVLTPRQRQTIELMAGGYSNKEIASQLNLSIETVNTHVKQILKKLQARDRAQAVAIALRKSMIV